MIRRASLGVLVALAFAFPALADPIDDLADAMHFPRLFTAMEKEGKAYAAELEAELFAGRASTGWHAAVDKIHDADLMSAQAVAELRSRLAAEPDLVAQMTRYFTSEEGRAVVEAEITAREALLNEDLREAALGAMDRLEADNAPRGAQLNRLIEIHDLIEQNVAGAMNSSLAFSRGLNAFAPKGMVLPEGDMLADLYAQEPQIRSETVDWLRSYLALAYQPVGDEALQRYIEFCASEPGMELNTALFGTFDVLFNRASEALGRATGQEMLGQDI